MKESDAWLNRFAKATVVAAFTLILIGSLVTTKGAGMAFADWPLSASSINPDGWWANLFERLEHGHRLFAEFTGCLVGILCAWIWGNRWAVPAAFLGSGLLSFLAATLGAPRPWIAHIGLWSSALIFAGMLLSRGEAPKPAACQKLEREAADQKRLTQPPLHPYRPALVRWLGFAAFCGVIAQAILGGMRVTFESGGDSQTAMIFRVLHGCFAQIEFCLLVAIAATLDWCRGGCVRRPPGTNREEQAALECADLSALCIGETCLPQDKTSGVVPPHSQAADTAASTTTAAAATAWMTFAVVFFQLLLGASMRHLGVGLVIPTFPQASPSGSWLPMTHNLLVDINFSHTRIGALLVALCIGFLARKMLQNSGSEPFLRRSAWLLLVLVAFQVMLGITILATHRAVLPTTLHVLNGAAILATTLLVALRCTLLTSPEKPEAAWGLSVGSFSSNPPLPGTAS